MTESTSEYKKRIEEIKQSIENEPYMAKMREDIAEGISKTGIRQATVEEQFQSVLDETTGKDIISAPEIILARDGAQTLGERLDSDKAEVTAQLAQTEQENKNYHSEFIKDLNIINPEHLNKWRAKRARMLDEDVKAKIAFWGDSITEGYYATYPLPLEAKRTKTFVGLLNQYYKNNVGDVGIGYAQTMVAGVTDETSEWSWDNGFIARQDAYTRTSIRSTIIGSVATLPFDGVGIDIVFIKAKFYGLAKIYIDDNYIKSVNLVTGTTTQVIHTETIDGLSDGNHTLKVEHETGSFLTIIGALPLKGNKGVITMNFARSGDRTDRLSLEESAFPNNTSVSLGLFDPDVVCIGYHTNDAGHNTGIGTYIERLSDFVDKALAQGSEVILIAQSAKRDTVLTSKTVAYRNAMRSVAIEKGVCMVDWTGRWLYGNEIDKIGDYLYDGDHYNEAGHQDMFEMLVRALEM